MEISNFLRIKLIINKLRSVINVEIYLVLLSFLSKIVYTMTDGHLISRKKAFKIFYLLLFILMSIKFKMDHNFIILY